MRGWLADFFRGLVAPWYWNTRKLMFAVRGRRGACPCHNPSDSGAPGETRCEAVTYWQKPGRFARRVCPLLKENEAGEWRCSAGPDRVRPFWGRLLATYAVAASLAVAVVGGGLWLTMRGVGYDVGLRQIFWPSAWHELRGVRAKFFRQQAEARLSEGKFREALAALGLASELAPDDYETGMLLAQVDHLARPEHVDLLYRRLYEQHPARRDETSRVWFRSLLARAQLAGVADLAARRLGDAPAEWRVWLHGLLLAARWTNNWELLDGPAQNERVPAEARAVLAFESRLRRSPWSEARQLLAREPMPAEAYAVMHRVERLLEWGDAMEALFVLRERGGLLTRRDAVRLVLAGHAVGRNRVALEREVRALLSREGADAGAGLALVGQHLVRHPQDELLVLAREAGVRLARTRSAERAEGLAALYCAAALGGRAEWLPEIREQMAATSPASLAAERRVGELVAGPSVSPLLLLGIVRPISVELNYALLERALTLR